MDQDDIYSCKACLDTYNQPVTLECGHSVCLVCADRLLAFHTLSIAKSESPEYYSDVPETWMENDIVLCPVCNQPTALLEKGADSLPPNNKLQSELENYTYALSSPSCGFGCGKNATLECLVCKCALCSECSGELHSKPAFQHHEIGEIGELTKRLNPSCLNHNKDLSMFCTTCKGMVCILCVTLDETHKGHNCISIQDYLSTCKEELTQGTDLLRARHAQLMISFLSIEKLLSDINTDYNDFESSVEGVFAFIQREIQTKKNDILERAQHSRLLSAEKLSKQASCLLKVANQIDSMTKNIHKTSSSLSLPVGALISTKRVIFSK